VQTYKKQKEPLVWMLSMLWRLGAHKICNRCTEQSSISADL